MTKRDFFRIIIKLFGLYSLILTLFAFLPRNAYILFYESSSLSVVWLLLVLGITVLIFIFLISKTDAIIDWLKLDKNFDDDQIVIGNMDNRKIILLAVLLIGGFLIIENLPYFLLNAYQEFRLRATGNEISLEEILNRDNYYYSWITDAINILLGILLIANRERIVTWFGGTKKRL